MSYLQFLYTGMKVPWLYVGMCFSTFCWHVEVGVDCWFSTVQWYKIWHDVVVVFPHRMSMNGRNKSLVPSLLQSQTRDVYLKKRGDHTTILQGAQKGQRCYYVCESVFSCVNVICLYVSWTSLSRGLKFHECVWDFALIILHLMVIPI